MRHESSNGLGQETINLYLLLTWFDTRPFLVNIKCLDPHAAFDDQNPDRGDRSLPKNPHPLPAPFPLPAVFTLIGAINTVMNCGNANEAYCCCCCCFD